MSGGIGGIGSMGNPGLSQMSSITKSSGEDQLLSVHKKKHHEEDTSFAAALDAKNISVIKSGAGGDVGTHVNKYA